MRNADVRAEIPIDNRRIKDLMIPLDEFAVVSDDSTLIHALQALKEVQKKLRPGQHPHRAVLIQHRDKRIIGKIGHCDFLRALEPKTIMASNLSELHQFGLSPALVDSLLDSCDLYRSSLSDLCRRAHAIPVTKIMHPITEHIDADAVLGEAIHKFTEWRILSTLVVDKSKPVGIIRLSDLFKEIWEDMIILET